MVSQKPIWDEFDCLLGSELFFGPFTDIIERYVGPGGLVTSKLEKYKDYIVPTAIAALSVSLDYHCVVQVG
jgi:hypothetical protein